MLPLGLGELRFESHGWTYFIFLILLIYLERKTTSRRAGLSATAEFLVSEYDTVYLTVKTIQLVHNLLLFYCFHFVFYVIVFAVLCCLLA